MTVTEATRQELQDLDDRAWQEYHDATFNPLASRKDRQDAFDRALQSLMMLLEHDQAA